jgi:hypothetical protein
MGLVPFRSALRFASRMARVAGSASLALQYAALHDVEMTMEPSRRYANP